MTQAEKTAKELYIRFYTNKDMVLSPFEAKQCALICVDEILNNERNTTMHPNDKIMYHWQEVKQAIYKL